MKTKQEILELLPIIKIMYDIGDKQYVKGMMNGYLESFCFEQFTFNENNIQEAFKYFEECFSS